MPLTHAGSVSLADFQDAYVHYLTTFPTLESLGTGDPPDVWKAELDVVSAIALDPMLALNANLEGGNVSGTRGFAQNYKQRALHAVRALRDEGYVNPYHLPVPDALPMRRFGSVVRVDGFGLESTR